MAIHNDLTRAFFPANDSACAFLLSATNDVGGAFSCLSFCLATWRQDSSGLNNSVIEHVEYRAERRNKQVSLVASRHDVAGPASVQPPITHILLHPVTKFMMEVFDGTNWLDHWPPTDSSSLPQAARLTVQGNKYTGETEIFIPAGNSFTSSLLRAADSF